MGLLPSSKSPVNSKKLDFGTARRLRRDCGLAVQPLNGLVESLVGHDLSIPLRAIALPRQLLATLPDSRLARRSLARLPRHLAELAELAGLRLQTFTLMFVNGPGKVLLEDSLVGE